MDGGIIIPFSEHKFNGRLNEGFGLLRWPLRTMQPAADHWTSFDRAVLQAPGILASDGANPFAYAGYDPVNKVDPLGGYIAHGLRLRIPRPLPLPEGEDEEEAEGIPTRMEHRGYRNRVSEYTAYKQRESSGSHGQGWADKWLDWSGKPVQAILQVDVISSSRVNMIEALGNKLSAPQRGKLVDTTWRQIQQRYSGRTGRFSSPATLIKQHQLSIRYDPDPTTQSYWGYNWGQAIDVYPRTFWQRAPRMPTYADVTFRDHDPRCFS